MAPRTGPVQAIHDLRLEGILQRRRRRWREALCDDRANRMYSAQLDCSASQGRDIQVDNTTERSGKKGRSSVQIARRSAPSDSTCRRCRNSAPPPKHDQGEQRESPRGALAPSGLTPSVARSSPDPSSEPWVLIALRNVDIRTKSGWFERKGRPWSGFTPTSTRWPWCTAYCADEGDGLLGLSCFGWLFGGRGFLGMPAQPGCREEPPSPPLRHVPQTPTNSDRRSDTKLEPERPPADTRPLSSNQDLGLQALRRGSSCREPLGDQHGQGTSSLLASEDKHPASTEFASKSSQKASGAMPSRLLSA